MALSVVELLKRRLHDFLEVAESVGVGGGVFVADMLSLSVILFPNVLVPLNVSGRVTAEAERVRLFVEDCPIVSDRSVKEGENVRDGLSDIVGVGGGVFVSEMVFQSVGVRCE